MVGIPTFSPISCLYCQVSVRLGASCIPWPSFSWPSFCTPPRPGVAFFTSFCFVPVPSLPLYTTCCAISSEHHNSPTSSTPSAWRTCGPNKVSLPPTCVNSPSPLFVFFSGRMKTRIPHHHRPPSRVCPVLNCRGYIKAVRCSFPVCKATFMHSSFTAQNTRSRAMMITALHLVRT